MTSHPDSEYHAADGMGIADEDPVDRGDEQDRYPEVRLVPHTETRSDDDCADSDPAIGDMRDADAEIADTDSHPGAVVPAAEVDLDADPANGSPGADWHDIQAMFVDDPRRSVKSAAEEADAAVAALAELLHRRRSALGTATAGAPDAPGETEELREMLRSYRIFCQGISDLGGQLEEPAATAR